jgi:ribose transport system ATP-binding protein
VPVLELRDIRKRFGQTGALDGVDVSLGAGEVHALIGENGAGKSTLMHVISGTLRPDSGSIELKGKPYSPASPLDSRRNGVALIHQELSLAPHLSVAENILMGMEGSRFGWINRKSLERQAGKVLEYFHHPDITSEKLVGTLSTAAQQVVEICRAIAANAEVILMDEPTSSLQRDDAEHLFALIRKLRAAGISIIYISHFLEEIREIADRFTVLRDGKSVATGKIADVTDDYLVTQMVGRPVENLFPDRRTRWHPGKPVLEVRELSARPALRFASFELQRGEILGIAGLMGAGRSEMVRVLFGIDKANSGTLGVNGRVVSARGGKPAARLLQGLGYLSEDRKNEGLALPLSIADNITMTRFSSCSRFGWLDLARQKQQAERLVAGIGIRAESAAQPVRNLSGGNQQKVAVAKLVHQQAEILLLDEPTRGIDIGSRGRIYQTIADLADEGKAVLLVSSYLPELFGMCDRLAVMSRGRLSDVRPIDEWTPELVMQAAIGSTRELPNGNNIDGH